jgi:hypothetical protein
LEYKVSIPSNNLKSVLQKCNLFYWTTHS